MIRCPDCDCEAEPDDLCHFCGKCVYHCCKGHVRLESPPPFDPAEGEAFATLCEDDLRREKLEELWESK